MDVENQLSKMDFYYSMARLLFNHFGAESTNGHLSKKRGNLSDLAETLGIDGTRVLSKHTKFGGHRTGLSRFLAVRTSDFHLEFPLFPLS